MSEAAADSSPPARIGRSGQLLLGLALALLVAVVIPPVATQARRYIFVEAVQFCVLLIGVPCLVVLAAPWRRWRLGAVERVASSRRRHRGVVRSLGWLLVYMALAVVWRTPPVVAALRNDPWLLVVETASLLCAGTALWLELADSPPLTARPSHPWRIALAAVAMWTTWITAYVLGLANSVVYPGYHGRRSGLSMAADQEIAAFVLMLLAAAAFIPLIFWNLITWLSSDEDPDRELDRVVREERRRALGR